MAAVLAGGPDAVLGHRASAVHRRLRRPRTDARPEVTTPRHVRGPAAVVLHRTRRVDPVDLTRRRGVPVTTVARTLVGLADAGLPAPRVDTAVALPDGALAEDDFPWPPLRLCVETDGRAAHATHLAFERDRRRDARADPRRLRARAPHRAAGPRRCGRDGGPRALVDDRRRAA